MTNHTRIHPEEKCVIVDSIVGTSIIEAKEYARLNNTIHRNFGKDNHLENVFELDFIFLPICRANHWYVAVIVHPQSAIDGSVGESW